MQGRCVSNKYALNVRLIQEFFIKIYPGLQHLGCCNILVAISTLLPPFYSLQVEESKKVQALINVQVRKLINVQAQNKAVQGDIRFPKRINAHARLLKT